MVKQDYIIEDTFMVCSFAIGFTPRKINRNPAPQGKMVFLVKCSLNEEYIIRSFHLFHIN